MRFTHFQAETPGRLAGFVHNRRGMPALLAVIVGIAATLSLTQVWAQEKGAQRTIETRPPVAELFLPELKAGTYTLIVRKTIRVGGFKATSDSGATAQPAWRDRAPAVSMRVPVISLRMPDTPAAAAAAPARVAKPAFQVRALDAGTFRVSKNFAMIDAPRQVVARKRFQAGWSGPNINGDRLELVASGNQACGSAILGISVHDYDVNRDGEFTFLAPMRSGDYELVYCSGIQKRVLARHRIKVVASQLELAKQQGSRRRAAPVARVQVPDRVATRRSVQLNSDTGDTRKQSRPKELRSSQRARPRFDDDDAGDFPRIRIISPVISIRPPELEDDRAGEPLFSVRPRRLDPAPKARPAFSARRKRFDEDRNVDPVISIRPRKRHLRRRDRNRKPNADDGSDIVNIAPRNRPRFDDANSEPRTVSRPRIRVFIDDDAEPAEKPIERLATRRRPVFESEGNDDFATRSERKPERVKRPRRRFFDDEPAAPVRTARRPVFEDDDFVKPRRRDRRAATVKVEPKRTVSRKTTRPGFDDDEYGQTRKPGRDDSTGNGGDGTRVIDRADDFKSDEVGVAAAIARNKARYGDETGEDADFFTIRDRYNWYKPVTANQARRTADNPESDNDAAARRQRRDRTQDNRDIRNSQRGDAGTREQDTGRVVELGSGDDFETVLPPRRRIPPVRAADRVPQQEHDLDRFSGRATEREFDTALLGPPVRDDGAGNDDFDSFVGAPAAPIGDIAMVPRTSANQVQPQFDRIQPVKAGYGFAAGWTGTMKNRGWVAIARSDARLDDYLSLQSASGKGELKFRAPSTPGRYELRFLSRDRRVVLARQSFEVEAAPVRLVALEFVDPADDLNVWWAGPGDGSDMLTLARVGTQDTRYLSKQSVGKGNPLTLKAPSQPGTYEMRYVNGTDNRVMFRRKLVVAESQPTLLGP